MSEASEKVIKETEETRDDLTKMLFRWMYPALDYDASTEERQLCLGFANKLMFCFYISTWELEVERLKELESIHNSLRKLNG